MGGHLTRYGNDLLNTADFLQDNDFFATYASAQEVVSNTFQPSGTDYIIHVLGDQQRENYLNSFKTGDFTYTATIKEDFDDWEYWIQRANWFFYRELYQNWHPVYANTYELYWERNNAEMSNILTDGFAVSVQDIDESTKKILIQCNETVNGYADVYIDYKVSKNNGRSSVLVIEKTLKTENTGTIYAKQGIYYESNSLPAESAEYIPIRIVNGYGEATLTSEPKHNTYLSLTECSCDAIYTVSSDYLEINSIEAGDSGSIFHISSTPRNTNVINSIMSISYCDIISDVKEITWDDSEILIYVNDIYELQQRNILELLR